MADVIIPTGFGSCAIRMLDVAEGKLTSFTWGYIMDETNTAEENAQRIRDALTFTGSLLSVVNYAAGTYFESVYVLEHALGGFRSAEVPVHILGTRSGAGVAPPQTALGMRKKTAFVGKRRRGRIYLPAMFLLSTDYTEGGRLAAPRQSTINASAAIALTQLNVAQVGMYLLHTHPDDAPDSVASLEASSILRTQRRRLPRS